jgi:chromosome partitioning protein
MKTLAIASQKGGTGKSTTSIHISSAATKAGLKVLLVDADHNSSSALFWGKEREVSEPLVVTAFPEDSEDMDIEESELIEKLDFFKEAGENEDYDLMVIDCPPYVNKLAIYATSMADLTIIPVRPKFNDLQTLYKTISRVEKPIGVLLSQCQPKINGMESGKTQEARRLIEENGISVVPVQITNRESYSDSLNGGCSVLEYEPKGKASEEVLQLWDWVKNEMGIKCNLNKGGH